VTCHKHYLFIIAVLDCVYIFIFNINLKKLFLNQIMVNPLSNAKQRIPKGFQSLLVGLTTEILRNQPKNIHLFAAEYFQTLLKQKGRNKYFFFIVKIYLTLLLIQRYFPVYSFFFHYINI